MSGLSPAAVSIPDEHSDYECFVADIQKDFELRVEAVQRAADENTRVYEVYSSELKKQLQESLVANQRLEECCAQLEEEVARSKAERKLSESKIVEIQQREQERVDGALELLSRMACVRVIQVEISGDITVYTCAIINGILKVCLWISLLGTTHISHCRPLQSTTKGLLI
ncbi:uncharacterized protein LOC135341289 isoform X2 [Halichondria panicea]|uniref:uncharacterized protein LOC135341289 isoform X2 n=1 Tax=Halichondria panicea TaxID=6063 RepID=UPI00312B6A5B